MEVGDKNIEAFPFYYYLLNEENENERQEKN